MNTFKLPVPGTLVTNLTIVCAKKFLFALCGAAEAPFRSTILTDPTVFTPYTYTLLPL